MTETPTEPQRWIHEVCKVTTDHDLQIRWGRDGDGDDPFLHVGADGVVVITSVTMFEHETYDPPPWVLHGIENKGWFIRRRKAPATGLVFHGAVDWKTVATGLADAMVKRQKPTQAEQAALDNYGIALAEEALAQESHQRPEPEEGDDDGSG